MPRVNLTKRFVDTIPYTEKGQKLYCDESTPGFYLMVGKGSKTFVVQKDIGGRAVRQTIGKYGHFTVEQARKDARERLYLLSTGQYVAKPEAEGPGKTLQVLLNEYLETRRDLKPRTRHGYTYQANTYLKDWLSKPFLNITRRMIGDRHAFLGQQHGAVTANQVMRLLRALFNFARAGSDKEMPNPVTFLTHSRGWYKERRRTTHLQMHQLKPWWNAVMTLESDDARDFMLLLLLTGLRRMEAATLKWVNVNLEENYIRIEDTKNGDPHVLPIGPYLEALLTRRQNCSNSVYVFPGGGATGHIVEPKRAWERVAELSGIHITCHDLRRTFVTIAESMDIGHYALKKLLNHKVADVTGGYIIINPERLRVPMERIEAFVMEKVKA